MKKSTFFILLIGVTLLFCSCGKDYDYRDKWVGEYQCKIVKEYHSDTFYTQEQEQRMYVKKNGDNGITFSFQNEYPNTITATIEKDGFLKDSRAVSFSGSFIGRDSVTFSHTTSGSGEGWVWYYYYCKKSK